MDSMARDRAGKGSRVMKLHGTGPLAVLALLLLSAAFIAAGCGSDVATNTSEPGGETIATFAEQTTTSAAETTTTFAETTTSVMETTTTVAETTTTLPETTTTAMVSTTLKVPAVSNKAIAYAESLGGTSHKGEHLYFVIGASRSTEQACQTLLDKAIPKFGDMQSYFIVQRSDNFQGLSPGWFIVIEAYKNPPDQYNLEFGRRGFPDLYVKSVTVKTSDPIPVYEDM
jgi:hypothetical protein